MQITVNIPDEFAKAIAPEGKDGARIALEALALEGYRSEALGENDVRRILGFRTNLQVHAFLKEHGVHLQYNAADLEEDLAAAHELLAQIESEKASGNRP